MRTIHKSITLIIFIFTVFISYKLNLRITNYTAQNLITAFSIFFGFYLTAISTLFDSRYMKELKKIEIKNKAYTADFVLHKYFLFSGLLSIFSIVSILLLSFASTLNTNSELIVNNNFRVTSISSSIVMGISAVNILFVIIIFKMLLEGLLHENYKDDI